VVVSKYGYDVYGARMAVTEGMATSWGFTGRRQDSSTEMYSRTRYLHSSAATWYSADPLGPFADLHGNDSEPVAKPLFSYVGDNPTRFADPRGLFKASEHTDITMLAGLALGMQAYELQKIAEFNNIVDHDQHNGWKHWMKSGSRITDYPNLLGGLAANYILEGGSVGGHLCIPDQGTTDSAAEAEAKARRWIEDNQAMARVGLCLGNMQLVMENVGSFLHTVQDRYAHRNHENNQPATLFEHCVQGMDTVDYPYLWEADFQALLETMKYLQWFQAERSRYGR